MRLRCSTQQGLCRRRRRGTAYVLVLAITTLLVTLGLAATQLAKGQIEQGEAELDVARARVAAQTAQDLIHKGIDGGDSWRDGAATASWYLLGVFDGVRIWYAYIDQIDGDLSDDYSEPFLLYTMANVGSAYRIYSVEYTADEDGKLTRNAGTFKQEVFAR